MAKNISTKVLCCLVVIAILMSTMPVSVYASSTGDNVKFRGVVTGKSEWTSAITWYVNVDEWISGSLSCDEINVYIDPRYPPWGSYDPDISKGDSVEVYGIVSGGDEIPRCTVGLNGLVYYIKKISTSPTPPPTLTPTPPPQKPDLIIKDISWSPSNPDEGDTIKITVKIKNQGSGSAESSKVKYYIDGSYEDYDSVSKLSAGSTSTEIFTWTADKCGDVKVKAVADANKVVTETSENNNDRTETVSINCLPSDIVIEDINWDPYNLVAGDPVDIAIIVRNKGKGKYVSPGNTRVDIKAIDKNNLIYGSAINEWVSTRWDIGDLKVGESNTLIFKGFIFNIPYLAESLRVELISAGDGGVSNIHLEKTIPQVRHNDDDFYKCMIDGVLICLTSGVKTTAALKKAGKVVDAIKQTFSSAQYYEELVEDLRQGQYEVFFSKIAKNKAEVIAQGDWGGGGLIGAIKAKAAKAYEFFDVFKNIVETGIACANVFEFYVDILEGWIRGGEDGGISSSGVVGASPIYILVEDEYGKEAGYDQSGTKKEEIEGSLVFTCDHFKTVLIPGKLDNTKITVVGYDREDVEPGKTISLASEGETDSSFTLSIVESSKTIIYEDVPVNPQTIGTIEINEYNPEYYLDLDYDGDGTTDNKVKPSSIETIGAESPVHNINPTPVEEWSKTFGGTGGDFATAVQQTSDGGYIIAGGKSLKSDGDDVSGEAWLVKTDSNGNKQWEKTFGGTDGVGIALSVQQTLEGGYIFAGITPPYEGWLVKTDSYGNTQWEKTFSTISVEEVQCTSDGGYILAGETASDDGWLVKIDSYGNTQWEKTFGGADWDIAHSVQQTSDGGYILAGDTKSYGGDGAWDGWLVKTDPNGNQEWVKTFGGIGYGTVESVRQTSDGGYILAGKTASDFWLVKTDTNGNKQWEKTFGGADLDGLEAVQQTRDGGYILAGTTESYGAGSWDGWLVRTDSNGNELWEKTFGGPGDDGLMAIQQTSDGGYILAGVTNSYGAGASDFWLIKVKEGEAEISNENTITNTIGMEFVPIPAGEFEMGSPSDEEGRWSAEGPVHHVNIGKAFYMGRYEVTQKQWRAIMGDNPSRFTGDYLPVEQVSWDSVQEFIKKLNKKEGTDKYRLPSEAEWEYACRAGTTTRYSFGDSESKLGDYAWYGDNSRDKTHPVGQKKSNSWELYDMYGNVREWVQDSWHDDYNGAPTDGSAWESGDSTFRVDHGGSWYLIARSCRSAFRGRYVQSSRYRALGFRLLKVQ